MWKYLGVVAAAILLAAVSPILAAIDVGLLMRNWLQWMPLDLYLMFLPDTELTMLSLALLVIALPYLLVLLIVVPVRPALRRLVSAIAKPLRRAARHTTA